MPRGMWRRWGRAMRTGRRWRQLESAIHRWWTIGLPVGQNTMTYSYAPASNLATVTYPNGLSSSFTCDDLNRLKSMNGYAYQVGPPGNRTSAIEPSGRAMNWTNDGVYRLTQYQPRSAFQQWHGELRPRPGRQSVVATSSLPGISFTYDANDMLSMRAA
jgi:uncharacterized protein RhaS with RHS repeats